MNLEELVQNYDVKLVALRNKRRFTSKSQGYAHMINDGNIMIPREWRKFQDQIEGWGILNQYIPDLGYYLCCLDVDTKDFPLTKLLSKYPTSIVETKHGYHIYYLSTDPIRLKQLTGKEKEICPVDLRGQRDPKQRKEGSYTKLYGESSGNLNIVNFNDVITYTYSLFGIEAKEIGEYAGNVQEWLGGGVKMKKVTNKEKFIAEYLFHQKTDWSTGYPDAFPWGVRLKGNVNEEEAYTIARFLMSISGYPRPKKWIRAFMTGFTNAKDGKPYFGNENLKPEMKVFIGKRFNELGSEDLKELAKLLQDVKLYQVLEVIYD